MLRRQTRLWFSQSCSRGCRGSTEQRAEGERVHGAGADKIRVVPELKDDGSDPQPSAVIPQGVLCLYTDAGRLPGSGFPVACRTGGWGLAAISYSYLSDYSRTAEESVRGELAGT